MPKILDSLPRLAELHREFVQPKVENFFWEFPKRLDHEGSVTFRHYQQIEEWLSHIPASGWDKYRTRVRESANLRHDYLYWKQLHDVLNEALGAKLLREDFGCDSLTFEPNLGEGKSPDWLGIRNGHHVYAEVKTCNHSIDESKSWRGELKLQLTPSLPQALRDKLTQSYRKAVKQLESPPDSLAATRVVVLVINLDWNIAPLELNEAELCASFLRTIELPDFPIRFCLSS